ncbi:MAG: hypothetical protein WBF90_33910 [Rivularia sp. (in: cyanobacteria)]
MNFSVTPDYNIYFDGEHWFIDVDFQNENQSEVLEIENYQTFSEKSLAYAVLKANNALKQYCLKLKQYYLKLESSNK